MKNLVLGIFISALMFSCTSVPKATGKVGKTQANILNTQWVLAEKVKGKAPTLIIENRKLSGNGGCNRYFGNLSLDPTVGNFTATQIGSTRMNCDNISNETSYINLLQQADKYVVSGDTLELYKGNLLLMKFSRQ